MSVKITGFDSSFKYEVAREPGAENIRFCFQCGDCTASCPVREVEARYNPRKIIHMVLLGMKERVFKSDFVWLCAACYSCQERCPQNVKISEVMNALKNLAVRSGYVHPSLKKQAELIQSFGRLYEIEDFDNKRRQRLGLPALKAKIEEVGKIFERWTTNDEQ